MKDLTIIMVGMNHLDLTQQALESLSKFTDPREYMLIFFDNGSIDNTESWVACFCRDHGIELKYQGASYNRGWIPCINQGYDMCETKYSLTCHNDVVFCKQWKSNMMRRFKDPEVGCVGPMISFAMGPQSYNFEAFIGCDVNYLLGLFFMADMSVLRTVKNKYGEILSTAYGPLGDKEELEISYRILQLGFKLEIARDVHIEHEGEKGFVDTMGSSDAFHKYQEKQRLIIDERLGKSVVDKMLSLTANNPIKLMVGILTRTEYVHYRNVISLLKIWGFTNVWKTFYHIARGHPASSRNHIVKEFLKTDCTHLLFIDDDMVFDQDAVMKLLAHDVDICTGIAYQRGEPYAPCAFILNPDTKCFHPTEVGEKKGMAQVDAVGGYFPLIKRHVLENTDGPWFVYGDISLGYNDNPDTDPVGKGIGEDIYFCVKAKMAGFEIWLDTSLEIKHIGQPAIIDTDFFTEYKKSGKFDEAINKFRKI